MILICGGGIIGLTLALEIARRKKSEKITIIEKEKELGLHASTKNSGVLHAGIYYTPDSLKAKLCIQGNKLMKEFCRQKGIYVSECGKVIVAHSEKNLATLEELRKRALKNGAKIEIVDEKKLKEIEPYAKTYKFAIFSPDTAVIDPKKVIIALEEELLSFPNVNIKKGVRFLGVSDNGRVAKTSEGKIEFDILINCAGAWADKIAFEFGIKRYKILPFKGIYYKLKEEKWNIVRGNIYPTPDLKNPFLGVHLTKSVYGEVFAGPTAMPALGRENYSGLQNINSEIFSILLRNLSLFVFNSDFRRFGFLEMRKYIKHFFFKEVEKLVEGISEIDLIPSQKVGIRAQLVDTKTKKLVMDFLIVRVENSLHILNAVSPAFTSSFAFAKYIYENYF